MNNAQSAAIIKARCKSKGIAVNTLLADCGIRKSLIYDMEKRDKTPSAEILEQIADYLECSVDYLIGRVAPMNSGEETKVMLAYSKANDEVKRAIRILLKLE